MEFMWQNAKTVICNTWDKQKINFLYVGVNADRMGTNLNLKKARTELSY